MEVHISVLDMKLKLNLETNLYNKIRVRGE